MDDPKRQTRMQKIFFWVKIWYLYVFRVADYESELKVYKFKIANPIWRTKMEKKLSGFENHPENDHESGLNIPEFRLADWIWMSKFAFLNVKLEFIISDPKNLKQTHGRHVWDIYVVV